MAGGAVGAIHSLTETRQGKYDDTLGPYSHPVLTVQPGDRNGPIMIDGAEKGDVVANGLVSIGSPAASRISGTNPVIDRALTVAV